MPSSTLRSIAGPPPVARFPIGDTRDTAAIHALVDATFNEVHGSTTPRLLPRVFEDVAALFRGETAPFAPIDLQYHDWEHTLQATLCLTLLLKGRADARVEPRIDARRFELAIAAALLHDVGYIKLRSDVDGTGAKYTYCHVLRSCAFAASYLPAIGVESGELETVLSAINCTGPKTEISRLTFNEPVDRIIGAAVATSDYLGQMAASDYPDELEILYREFEESETFLKVPPARRTFRSADALIAQTPGFWYKFVRPKLEGEFLALYRFLARPYPDGDNPYLDAVEANIAEIQRRSAEQQRRMARPVTPDAIAP